MTQERQQEESRTKYIRQLKSKSGQLLSVIYLLPLAACGGGGAAPVMQPPPPPPVPDYAENPTGTFTGKDGSNLTLSQGAATGDLIVNSLDGNDSITTGSGADTIIGAGGNDTITSGDGADLIRGGLGADVIDAGAGDDVIVVVGLTAADQYTDSDITNPGGSGFDLSSLLTLTDLNGQTTSEAAAGESVDGGTGANTLVVFGDMDLSQLTLQNLTVLQVNSTITMSPGQLAQFTTVNGNGQSVLNIVDDPADGAIGQVDLSQITFSGISEVNFTGDVAVSVSGAGDLAGVTSFTNDGGLGLVLVDDGTGTNSVTTSSLVGTLGGIGEIQVESTVTLVVDDATSLATLGVTGIGGAGSVQIDSTTATATTLAGITLDDDVVIVDEIGTIVDPTTLGAVIVADPDISISDVTVLESAGTATFTVTLSSASTKPVNVDFNAPDGTTGTVVFAAGETSQTFTTAWVNDGTIEPSEILSATLSNAINADLVDASGTLTIRDDDVTSNFVGLGESFLGTTGTSATDIVAVDLVAGQTYRISANPDQPTPEAEFDTLIADILDPQGNSLGLSDDDSGSQFAATLIFTPTETGTFFVVAGASNPNSTGRTFDVLVTELPALVDDFSNALDPTNAIAVWETQDATIETAGDTDTIAIDLVAGVAVDITVYGNDNGTLGELVGADILSFLDPGGVAVNPALFDTIEGFGTFTIEIEQITFTPTVTGTYFLTVGSNIGVGSYSVSVAEQDKGIFGIRAHEPFALTGNPEIDAFFGDPQSVGFFQNDEIASDRDGDGTTTFSYSLLNANSQFSDAFHNPVASAPTVGFAPADGVVLDTFLSVMTNISSFANIAFVEIPDTGVQAGNFRIGTSSLLFGPGANGWSGFPRWGEFGETWINPTQAALNIQGTNITLDEFLINRTLHEFSHNLGLAHLDRSAIFAPQIDPAFLGQEYSVMSRTPSGTFPGAFGDLWPQTLMWFDIQAIQAAYGVDTVTTAGADTYTFDTSQEHFSTLWDFGGNDTLVLTGSADAIIDLTPGTWQDVGTTITYSDGNGATVGTRTDTVFIAPDTTIENVLGGAGNDSITGNDLANLLNGGAGNDTLTGGAGADTFQYSSVLDGNDVISDFSTVDDVIDLDTLFDALGIAPAARDVVLTEDGGGNTLLNIDTNNDGAVDNPEFSILLNGVTLADLGADPVAAGLIVLSDI